MIEIWGKIEWKVIQWEVKTQWKIKNQIRSETAFDKLKEKISKLECRSHETFQKTWKKDKVSDYIKGRLKHRLPRWLSGKKFSCQCRRHKSLRFNRWVRKVPWRRKWQPTPVVLPRKIHGQWSLFIGLQRVRHSWAHVCAHIHTHTLTHMEYRMRKAHNYYSKAIQT